MKKEQQLVLETNEAFYSNFCNNDLESMESLWSSQHDIAVIHPGWPPIHGRHAVISSWRQILTADNPPRISCLNASANLLGEVALVICTELLAEVELVATNTFVLEVDGWKMIHHQAGPLPQALNTDEGDILH